MIEYTREQFMEKFQVSKSSIDTNFPKLCANLLKKGFKVTKIGKGLKALY